MCKKTVLFAKTLRKKETCTIQFLDDACFLLFERKYNKAKDFASYISQSMTKTSFELLCIHLCTIIVYNRLYLRICRNICDVIKQSIRFNQLHFAINDSIS